MYKLKKYRDGVWKSCENFQHVNLDDIVAAMKRNYTDLSRWIWPLCVVDEFGKICVAYDPERDTRNPGCRHDMIERKAYHLWEHSDRSQPSEHYWNIAESTLEYSDGIFEVDNDYEWNN